MKKNLMIFFVLFVFFFCITNVSAQKTDYNIVGSWNPMGTSQLVKFTKYGEVKGNGIDGTYMYDGEKLVLNLRREYKYRTITTLNAFIEDNKLYFSYPSKGYLIGNKNNDGLLGEWEAYRLFSLVNSKTNEIYEDRFEYLKLRFWDNYLTVNQSYDTHEESWTSYSYGIAYDEVAQHHYFYSLTHPEDRTYYEIVELEDRRLLLLSHKYKLNGENAESVVFSYPCYIRV